MPPTANPAASDPEAKKRAARETIDILHEISTLLVRQTTLTKNSEAKPILTTLPEDRSRPPIAQLLRVSDRKWRES